ncbi:MAG: 1-deoxy-D-xylulose-5-phosphate reductoisomerase [Planctomycetota bacterium]
MNRSASPDNTKTSPRRIAILGSTGSIGLQTLEVIAEANGLLQPVLLSAGHRVDALREQLETMRQKHPSLLPERVVIIQPDQPLPDSTNDAETNWLSGEQAQLDAIQELDLDLVLNGITGAAGLRASMTTLQAGIDLALANKESLVTAGPLLTATARKSGAQILPVDSEHSAIQQCIADSAPATVQRIIITASGGPFRGFSTSELQQVTPEQALQHPTWKMGARISVDSATLFNKTLEVIEAQQLFGTPPRGIEVLVHPQSIVHAIVEFQDGSSIAQLGEPDMKVPIRNALFRGERPAGGYKALDLLGRGASTFEEVDAKAFPALDIGTIVLENPGTTLGAVLNAADEEAVAAFLAGDVGFLQIYDLVRRALSEHSPTHVENLEQVIAADQETRQRIRSWTT